MLFVPFIMFKLTLNVKLDLELLHPFILSNQVNLITIRTSRSIKNDKLCVSTTVIK